MRNVLKYAAIAGFGVAMSMSMAAPSFATTDNVKGAVSYFVDCLKKLGTDQNCGAPHPMDTGTSSIASGGGGAQEIECYCGYIVHYGDDPVCKHYARKWSFNFARR